MVTIRDVAQKAGVNISTAMRAMNGKTKGTRSDARERAERVQRIARELGYVPSEVARSLRSGTTKTIGLVTGGLACPHFGYMADIMFEEANKHGYKLLLEISKWGIDHELESIKDLMQRQVDGIIVTCEIPEENNTFYEQIYKRKMPFMTVRNNKYGFCPVVQDHAKAMTDMIEFFQQRGHQEVAIVIPNKFHTEMNRKIEFFQKACNKFSCKPIVYRINNIETDSLSIIKKRHEALFITGNSTLDFFIDQLKSINGYEPDITGLYSPWNCDHKNNYISGYILVDEDLIAEIVVRKLIKHIEEGKKSSNPLAVQTKFFPGNN